ncbi:unnamed protein product, partial [marine sediment metagenome]
RSCKPKEWKCTADLAVYLTAPRSLKKASKALLNVEVSKTVRDNLCGKTPEDIAEKGMTDEVRKYALMDSQLCYDLWDWYHTRWPDSEQRLSKKNREDSRRGVQIDTELLTLGLEHLNQLLWTAGNLIPWDWDENKTPLSHKALRQECRKEGIDAPASLAQDSQDCIKWENKYGDTYPWIAAIRQWRRANIMHKRLRTIQTRLRPDGTFPFAIKYFGAHTGRFSGADGFNMQNMPRGENMGVDLRALFVPRSGKKLVIVDLAQIEARVILWLARDFKALEQVKDGMSIYEAHAIQSMNWKPNGQKLKDVDLDLYQLAKARVLGLGFGCGSKRFKDVAKKMAGIDISMEQAVFNVQDFRASNLKIVKLWNDLQRSCAWSRGKNFDVELPSGRELHYYNVRS